MEYHLPETVRVLTCNNPSPMTLEGTNTYLIGDPAAEDLLVIDPGPEGHPEHVAAILAAAGQRRVRAILVTHRHHDHLGAAAELAEKTGAPIRGYDPAICAPGSAEAAPPLTAEERISAGGTAVTVLHTPGHTSDSVSFWLPAEQAVLTGDTVLGRGTTMLDFPDGTLGDYLNSLTLLKTYDAAALLPAHGPAHQHLGPVVDYYIQHRHQRLEEAQALLDAHGDLTAEELGRLIYGADTPVPPAILAKIAGAQLEYLTRDA